ncbi:hypothetical protein OH738_30405 [Streptomyces hirsutus]|uniref:Uncharacterized protein n=1 Tax=Streptomyces hirsutus TaxID=35620 RepID=A0ABZ1GII6_9ACTN|nr:hypothetical protein [Streptomyces hirsutus]WSD05934.1 hypothetical protein OIE73_09265 [Streptomyces hirsutus]WTD20650.1 hypothetical protein OH738_30405 [Streptomyces hirsutus]
MGIRMLHRRAAFPRAAADGPTPEALSPVPVFAADASTARTPVSPAVALRRATADLGRRIADGPWHPGLCEGPGLPGPGAGEPPAWRRWAELVRGCLTLALTLLPRPRPVRTVTVFVAAGETLSVRPYGSAAAYQPPRGPQGPGPDATP